MWDYNQGNPSGDPRPWRGGPSETPLVAFYPSDGALVADHPYVTLTSDWVTTRGSSRRPGVPRFLLAPAQQGRFQALGFRDHDGVPGPEINLENGLIPAAPVTITPPGGRRPHADPRRLARVPQASAGPAPHGRLRLDELARSRLGPTKLQLAQAAALER